MSERSNVMHPSTKLAALAVLAALAPTALTVVPAQDDFQFLFNGRDLSDWEGDVRHWSVKDGAITGRTTADAPLAGNTFLVWRGGTLQDFELRLRFRILADNPEGSAN